MKERRNRDGHKTWAVWLSIIAILIIGAGIFFYYAFLRQSQAELIEAVPNDVVFLYEINDHDGFVKSSKNIQPYLNELFVMDGFNAYESMYHKLSNSNLPSTISGHYTESGMALLFNTRIDKATFRKLLRSLSIDPANYTAFEQFKIYTYGANFKSLKFVYFNHILSISDNVELLKSAVTQHKYPKNLLADKGFKSLYEIAEKNKKQNWIFLNNPVYYDFLETFFNSDVALAMGKIKDYSKWSAYQIRFSHNDVFLSGYVTPDSPKFDEISKRHTDRKTPESVMPFHTQWYYKAEMAKHTAYQFALANDSAKSYRYLIIEQDSLNRRFNLFKNNTQAELLRNNFPNGIYPAADSLNKPELSSFDKGFYQYILEKDGYFIFAPSQESIDLYFKDINTNGTITDNRYYQLANSNMASENLLEYAYFNNDNQESIQKNLSEKGKNALWGKHLKVFTISFNNLAEGFATVNIYAGF